MGILNDRHLVIVKFIIVLLLFSGCSPSSNELEKEPDLHNIATSRVSVDTLRELTVKSANLVLDVLKNVRGLTKNELQLIENTEIEVFYSDRFNASSLQRNGKPIIRLSTAYVELSFLIQSELNVYVKTGDQRCFSALRKLSEKFQNRNSLISDTFHNLKHDCPGSRSKNPDQVQIITSGYVAVPLIHELAHILRGDIYKLREESIQDQIILELKTDVMSVQLLPDAQLLAVGLPLFLFLDHKKLERGQDHPYLPALCRASILLNRLGGIHGNQFGDMFGIFNGPLRQTVIFQVLMEKIIANQNIGGGLKCPSYP